MRTPKIEVYEAVSGDFWWTLHSANGKIIADSGEGYSSKRKAVDAAKRVVDAAKGAVLVVDGKAVVEASTLVPTGPVDKPPLLAADVNHVGGPVVSTDQPMMQLGT